MIRFGSLLQRNWSVMVWTLQNLHIVPFGSYFCSFLCLPNALAFIPGGDVSDAVIVSQKEINFMKAIPSFTAELTFHWQLLGEASKKS